MNYHDFYAPEAIILIDNEKVSTHGIHISDVQVEQTLDGANSFSFTVVNALDYENNPKYEKIIQFGNRVEIKIGYKDEYASVIIGLITSINWNFTEGNYLDISVEGHDYLFLLMKNQVRREPWLNQTDSQVVKSIMKEPIYTIFKKSEIYDTQIEYPYIRQERESDYDFIVKKLAKRNGLEVLTEGETFYFREPNVLNDPTFTLSYGEELLTFTPRFNLAQQVSRVEVYGWNPTTRATIIGKASAGDIESVEEGNETSQHIIQQLFNEEITHTVRAPVYSQDEADTLAKSILSELSNGLVTGSATAVGLPDFKPGIVVRLKKVGEYFSHNYYVNTVTHNFNEGSYQMNFTIKGNSYHESN